MVDFLNFVTQVQLFFNSNLDNLANSKLTQEQLALATDTVVCVDRSLADARSSGLNMEVGARLALKFYFNVVERLRPEDELEESIDNMTFGKIFH